MKKLFRLGSLFLVYTAIVSTSHAQMTQSDIDIPYKSITPQTESTIGRTAIIALRHISQARSDIHHKELPTARRDVAEAERLMDTIKDDLSTATAKNFIQIARKHLEQEQAKQVLHDLPPIYSSLEMISVYLPTDKARLHIDRARSYLEKNDKLEAEWELALADKSLIIIEVELPLLKMQRYVARAQEYLVKKDGRKADEALQVAEQRAIALYTGINSPLFHTQQNLWLTFQNYSTATRADTGKALSKSRNYLEKMAANGSTKEKEEVGKLSSELAGLEKKITGEGKVAESDLKAAWEKSMALSERSAAYLSAGLSEAETTLGAESNLIEAKLHVRYAETYQVTTSEPDKAVKELDTALSYLEKAANNTLTEASDRKKIHEIRNILLDIKLFPKENDITVQDRYDAVINNLSELSANNESSDQIQKIRNMW
jgi:hypothetical protein